MQSTGACWIPAPALTSSLQGLPEIGFMLVGSSSAPVPRAPPISCPCPAPSSLPHLVSYWGCLRGTAWGEGLLPALHSQPEGTDTPTPLLCPCCRQPACSSISQLDYCPSLKQVRLQTPHNVPTPMLFLARVSPHAFFACSQQRTLAFFAKSLPSTWMQEGKRGKDAELGHMWALEQQEMGPSQAAFQPQGSGGAFLFSLS